MAASGINEHKEGCRKQRVLDRAANARKRMMENLTSKNDLAPELLQQEDPEAPGYMRKMGSPPGICGSDLPASPYYSTDNRQTALIDPPGGHSPTAIDRLRREGVRAQQLVAYSAKIPNRLSSVNYTQQW